MQSGPVVICYDESKAARAALATVAELLPGAPALVVTAWKPILKAILSVSLGPAPAISDLADADERQRRAAETIARDGARLATEAGLEAEPLAVKADETIWEAIAEVAEERRARLIACAASRVGLTSALLDTVPTALTHRATRPVLVVPSPEASTERRREMSEKKDAGPVSARKRRTRSEAAAAVRRTPRH
jgi:nucleotide-binding universal stress UspA family protein